MPLLPERFRDLERFAEWALASERERADKRHASTIEEIKEFYDALVPRMDEVLDVLSAYPDEGNLSDAERRLFHLALSLAEVGPAVEWFGQPAVIQGFDYRRYLLVES